MRQFSGETSCPEPDTCVSQGGRSESLPPQHMPQWTPIVIRARVTASAPRRMDSQSKSICSGDRVSLQIWADSLSACLLGTKPRASGMLFTYSFPTLFCCHSGWPRTHFVQETGLKRVLLPQHLECWDCICAWLKVYFVFVVLLWFLRAYFYVYRCFACIYVCTLQAYSGPEGQKRASKIRWNWSYRTLIAPRVLWFWFEVALTVLELSL